jgi:hypothetical protein
MINVKVFYRDIETSELQHVATVGVPSNVVREIQLEYAWDAVQNVEGSWSRGPIMPDGSRNRDAERSKNIVYIAPLRKYLGQEYGHRSSMTGDIFEIESENWEVACCGFKRC